MEYVKKLTEKLVQEILSQGVRDMPQNPGAQGYTERQIRQYFYVPEEKILRLIQEVETAIAQAVEDLEGSGTLVVDKALSNMSTNPVQNMVITDALAQVEQLANQAKQSAQTNAENIQAINDKLPEVVSIQAIGLEFYNDEVVYPILTSEQAFKLGINFLRGKIVVISSLGRSWVVNAYDSKTGYIRFLTNNEYGSELWYIVIYWDMQGTTTKLVECLKIATVEDIENKIGDISTALNELHTYAQSLINGGVSQ